MHLYNRQLQSNIGIWTDDTAADSSLLLELPAKKPYLLISLAANLRSDPYFEHNFFQLEDLGYSKIRDGQLIISITGKLNMVKAIEKMCSQRSYRGLENVQQLQKLQETNHTLKSILTPKNIPRKSKNFANYQPVIYKNKNQIESSQCIHKTINVKKINKETVEIFKAIPSGRRITEIEAFNGLCYRLLLNAQTPKVRSVHDADGQRIGVLSRAIANFQSLHDYFRKNHCSPSRADLIKSHFGRVLAAAYCEEENDLHGGNIGFDPIKILSYKIDHDEATWPFTSKYRNLNPLVEDGKEGRRAYGVRAVDAFPITQNDIDQFPHLSDAKPRSFPDTESYLDLKDIEKDEDFIHDVFCIFLKRALLNGQIYRNIAEETIGSKTLRDNLVAHKDHRTHILRAALIKNEKFSKFIITHPNLKKQLLNEFREYNNDYKPDSPLRLDLSEISNQFDSMKQACDALFHSRFDPTISELFIKHYQPEMDYDPQQHLYNSNLRKTRTLEEISVQLHVNKVTAEHIFTRAHAQWLAKPENNQAQALEQAVNAKLEEILERLIALNGKLGLLGGQTRRLENGKEIKIANGATAIFDQLMKHKTGENPSAQETLDSIISQANASNNFKEHYFFNRRQKETTLFYESITKLNDNSSLPRLSEP